MANQIKNTAPQPTLTQDQTEAAGSELRSRWSTMTKALVSVVIVYQLVAVVAEPFQFFTRSSRGTSPLSDVIRWPVGPYIEFAYLNHGYFFFAPEPGPSHLIDCTFEREDGRIVTVQYPDRKAQWPRLLYHRHFMLTENLHQLWQEPFDKALLARELPAAEREYLLAWQAARGQYERVRDSMGNHVADKFGADAVVVERVEHRLPTDQDVFRKRKRINAKEFYVTLPDAPLLPPAERDPQVPGPEASSPFDGSMESPMPLGPVLPQAGSLPGENLPLEEDQ
ncbi:MAG: hypothetical protein AAGG44_01820 [Planctomycetota bacterium]